MATEHGLPHVELDALFWDDTDGGYDVRRDSGERDRRLAKVVDSESWVIEGVYYSWCQPSFERADQIILLDTPTWIRHWRLGLRFIKRKLGIEPKGQSRKKDSFKGYWGITKWNASWNRDNLVGAKEVLKRYESKLKLIH
ncbi:MAG TPA: DNA topology modulation protein FlaR [bacterium]|nr:DNA topology modulation protein FlaR [bacterium]